MKSKIELIQNIVQDAPIELNNTLEQLKHMDYKTYGDIIRNFSDQVLSKYLKYRHEGPDLSEEQLLIFLQSPYNCNQIKKSQELGGIQH